MEEVIENVQMLLEDAPRTQNADTKVGLYIELKGYDDKLKKGVDEAQMLFDVLNAHGLGTIADCSDKIPIVVQSFDKAGLKKMATLTDLPLVQLVHDTDIYDYDEIAQFANGVGPPAAWIMNSLDNIWSTMENDVKTQDDQYSKYIQ